MKYLIILLSITFLNANYDVGDTIAMQRQMQEFDVCYGSGGYATGDLWKFADYNGDLNGGDYNIIVIKNNATW